ncbi:hypothetical protein LJ739_01905 [Aestuariibacter halophilus]|uniref:Uncharacterized protein n=1 Tax=Fluctibacter halophilus TaxID=226011 RepID=A0ABS8G5P5_9ALTE|nr:hypothetical protein [Aestuariibacter halophilus]MCC2614994.1 hypothetical protein [Aestuariibacter halophilus]
MATSKKAPTKSTGNDPLATELASLQQRMDSLESDVKAQLASLEASVQQQLANIAQTQTESASEKDPEADPDVDPVQASVAQLAQHDQQTFQHLHQQAQAYLNQAGQPGKNESPAEHLQQVSNALHGAAQAQQVPLQQLQQAAQQHISHAEQAVQASIAQISQSLAQQQQAMHSVMPSTAQETATEPSPDTDPNSGA